MKEYKVGYKKPPVEHQIRPGFTKNYGGRPNGQAAPPPATTDLDPLSQAILQEAARKIMVREGDEVKEVSVLDAMARQLSSKGMKDVAAGRLFFRLLERAGTAWSSRLEEAFAKGIEDKIAHLVTFFLLEMDGEPTDDMPLHPDRIVLREDGRVEVLPTLAAAQDRRARLARRNVLEAKAAKLQKLINQKHRPRDVEQLKEMLAELRPLKKSKIVGDMPGIEDVVRRQAEQRVAAIRGSFGAVGTMSREELHAEMERRGLPLGWLEE